MLTKGSDYQCPAWRAWLWAGNQPTNRWRTLGFRSGAGKLHRTLGRHHSEQNRHWICRHIHQTGELEAHGLHLSLLHRVGLLLGNILCAIEYNEILLLIPSVLFQKGPDAKRSPKLDSSSCPFTTKCLVCSRQGFLNVTFYYYPYFMITTPTTLWEGGLSNWLLLSGHHILGQLDFFVLVLQMARPCWFDHSQRRPYPEYQLLLPLLHNNHLV